MLNLRRQIILFLKLCRQETCILSPSGGEGAPQNVLHGPGGDPPQTRRMLGGARGSVLNPHVVGPLSLFGSADSAGNFWPTHASECPCSSVYHCGDRRDRTRLYEPSEMPSFPKLEQLSDLEQMMCEVKEANAVSEKVVEATVG